MSGFVALLNTDEAPVDRAQLSRMTAAMAFRGPDAQHTWANERVGLGHALFRATRESGREVQPCSLDGDVRIVADARIDGRADLVRRLQAQGNDATVDAPDVELILRAYLAWGDNCLDELIGDFAFVLWDGHRRTLLAARDQLGVAQLFYAQAEATLLLGNTLQSLLVHPGVPQSLDEQTLADVALFTVYLDDAATGYTAIRRLPPGHRLIWDARGRRIERYWTVRRAEGRVRYRRPEEYAEHFRTLFDQAVNDRLRTDRVGSQLSGGMDSTSIAVTARHLLQANGRPFDLRAYAIEYRSLLAQNDEEGTLAAQVGSHAGFPVEVLPGEDYLGREPPRETAWTPPEPGAATLSVMAEVCRRTTAFARVLLVGYGGDPLLHPPDLSWRRAWTALRQGQWKWAPRRLVMEQRLRRRRLRPHPLPAWVNPEWARRMDLAGRSALFHERARREQVGLAEAPLWRALFAWSDAGYSGFGLDIRFPFFDLRLLEFVLAVPPAPWLDDKRLLRNAMGDRLPDRVRTRPKTVMAGNVALERNTQLGVPAWEIDLLTAPEMEAYVDERWLRSVRQHSPAEQAQVWASQRPPVELAHWLHHRRGGNGAGLRRPENIDKTGGDYARANQ